MTNFEDLAMRDKLTEFLVEKIFKFSELLKTREDVEFFAKWLQQDVDDILVSRSDVIRVLKSHLDKNTIDNEQFQKLLSDVDFLEPREQIGSEEVEHGEWIYDKVAFYRICPKCGCGIRVGDDDIFLNPLDYTVNYCPSCGLNITQEGDEK